MFLTDSFFWWTAFHTYIVQQFLYQNFTQLQIKWMPFQKLGAMCRFRCFFLPFPHKFYLFLLWISQKDNFVLKLKMHWLMKIMFLPTNHFCLALFDNVRVKFWLISNRKLLDRPISIRIICPPTNSSIVQVFFSILPCNLALTSTHLHYSTFHPIIKFYVHFLEFITNITFHYYDLWWIGLI